MPRQARRLLDNIVCHHMLQGINKENIFKTDNEKQKYLSLLKKYYQKFEIDIIAYCIMDNHVHLLLHASKIQKISDFMRKINTIYAIRYNKIHDRVGYVFRNRFQSVPIKNREQMYTCIKYIHMNPVKAGIVRKEKDYKYSSYNDYLNKTGFLNQRILDFVFNSSNNYIEKFQNITYQNFNIDNEKKITDKTLEDFLAFQNITLEQMKNKKELVKKFIEFLNCNNYNFSKKSIAELLKISRGTLYRWIG